MSIISSIGTSLINLRDKIYDKCQDPEDYRILPWHEISHVVFDGELWEARLDWKSTRIKSMRLRTNRPLYLGKKSDKYSSLPKLEGVKLKQGKLLFLQHPSDDFVYGYFYGYACIALDAYDKISFRTDDEAFHLECSINK